MNLGDDPDLYQLYGNMGNVRVVPIRNICRQRIEGHSPWFTNQTLKDHADDAQELAATIEAKGGAIGAMKQCEHIEDVLRYWAEDPNHTGSNACAACQDRWEGIGGSKYQLRRELAERDVFAKVNPASDQPNTTLEQGYCGSCRYKTRALPRYRSTCETCVNCGYCPKCGGE